MRILWVATKAPWPRIDGGRVLLHNTLRALTEAGHRLTLLAPVSAAGGERDGVAVRGITEREIAERLAPLCRPVLVEVERRPMAVDLLTAQLRRLPLTVVRHGFASLRQRASELIVEERPQLVVAEQIQALHAAAADRSSSAPVVLRAQNVESDLWAQSARLAGWRRLPLTLEARRLAAWEGRQVARCAATLALTAEDRARLVELSGAGEKIHPVPAPFDPELPPADAPLAGSPAVVVFGSGGWRPNAGGAAWLLREVWPRVMAEAPGAVLHVFGLPAQASGVVAHPAPEDSRAAYAAGSVLAVPLRVASGVRIKILEAWARGVPVIATPQAASGLAAEDGRELLVSDGPDAWARALRRLAEEPELAARLIEGGRRRLREHHALPAVADRLSRVFESVVSAPKAKINPPRASA